MSAHLQVRLLGGFRVEGGAVSPGSSFESQKVRALLAYLACHAGQPFSREQLGDLLWPEEDPGTGRHNLRQALYSLRRGLGERSDVVVSDHHALRLQLAPEDSLDVAEMETAYHRGFPATGDPVPARLARVAELYQGDFLSGFAVRESAPFEDWMLTEQERLRDMAMQALSTLVDHYSARGEYDLAIAHCHRLLETDPLSEEAHHELIRHYLLSGRRGRAIRHYEELAALLERELGVEPPAATRALYENVRGGGTAFAAESGVASPRGPVPVAPFVPLVGREDLLKVLERSWRDCVDGGARLALVNGEAGVGKTRLCRSFLDRLSSQRLASIAQGRCTAASPWCAGHPLSGVLRELLGDEALRSEPGDGSEPEPDIDSAEFRLCEAPDENTPAPLEVRLVAALERRFSGQGGSPGRRLPQVLFLDDLHLASGATCRTVGHLLDRFADRPLWILATLERDELAADHPLFALADRDDTDTVAVPRLTDEDIHALCDSLLDEPSQLPDLALHLMVASEGLPLAAVEAVNALWDLGLLISHGPGHWSLEGEPAPKVEATADDLRRLILRRVGELPTSTRRLLTLAAVIGVTFDVGLLQAAAREHIGVVEIGLEQLLEHCLVRHYARRWHRDPRERDLVLWAQGSRRATFEFAHPRIREVIYHDLPESRRRFLHADVARTLAERGPPRGHADPQQVAFHYLEGGRGDDALPYLEVAVDAALERGQTRTASRLAQHGLDAVGEGGLPEGWENLVERCRAAAS